MHTKIRNLIIVMLASSLWSCETFRDIEIPRQPDKLVVNGLFSTDSIISISVSRSNYILENEFNTNLSVMDATVEIYENDQIIEELPLATGWPFDSQSISVYRSSASLVPSPDTEYSLKVSAPGFVTVSSTIHVPEKIELKNLEFEKKEVVIGQDYRGYPVSFEFQDDPSIDNYYRIEMYAIIDITYEDGIQTFTETQRNWLEVAPKVQEEQKVFDNYPFDIGLYVNDLAFNGKYHKMELFVDARIFEFFQGGFDFSADETRILAVVKHITEEHYEYGTSSDKQEDLLDDPFSEPIPVYSNVSGGLGIFAGYTLNSISIKLED